MGGKSSKYDNPESMLCNQTSQPLRLTFQYLKTITNTFSDEGVVGRGGSGVVYKGYLSNGDVIAVKKLERSLPAFEQQFNNEVYHLMRLNHRNIVRFLGYCYETQNVCIEHNGTFVFAEMAERLLCLEYLANGSLADYLTDESSGLEWDKRYSIIVGICYGLHYLHEQTDDPILHLDLKPANILLDNLMKPKITDFGLSRILHQQHTIYTSRLDGTLGYMAPEYLHGGTITPKSDIFSLGVIILEIITGHRDYPDVSKTSSQDFIELTLNKWRARNPLNKAPWYIPQIRKCIEIGLLSVNPERKGRPSTYELIQILEGRLKPDEFAASVIGAASFQMNLSDIHDILVKEEYREDSAIPSELSFQLWTSQMQKTLDKKRNGDNAFERRDCMVAIDFYTQVIDYGLIASAVVYVRRSMCYLMCHQPDAALRDLTQAQILRDKLWPTALDMQEIAESMQYKQSNGSKMLNDESHIEEKRRESETFSFQTTDCDSQVSEQS